MKITSTRDKNLSISMAEAIVNGISNEGGLYTPIDIDRKIDLEKCSSLGYQELAYEVLSVFLEGFSDEETRKCIASAYTDSFTEADVVRTSRVGDDYLLELYHGPTSAFKDVALTLLPHLMTTSYRKMNFHQKIFIPVATSGDTGKAALEGFKDVANTYITVLYPLDGVSPMQKRQMQTTTGSNVNVMAVDGNFDDCQRLVKEISVSYKSRADAKAIVSSANSINIGRLIPQIVYYFKAYFDIKRDYPEMDEIDFVVPTGNFGDILAGYYAKMLGLPIRKLVCASNANNVLTDFLITGVYKKKDTLQLTMSPSMDILVSSNLERLLFLIERDDEAIRAYMSDLASKGTFAVKDSTIKAIQESFVGYCADDDKTAATIKKVWQEHGRLIDTHTAVAYNCMEQYKKDVAGAGSADGANTTCNAGSAMNGCDKASRVPCVILSTASAYKFSKNVLASISSDVPDDEFACMQKLYEITGEPIPTNLASINQLEIRFDSAYQKGDVAGEIANILESI